MPETLRGRRGLLCQARGAARPLAPTGHPREQAVYNESLLPPVLRCLVPLRTARGFLVRFESGHDHHDSCFLVHADPRSAPTSGGGSAAAQPSPAPLDRQAVGLVATGGLLSAAVFGANRYLSGWNRPEITTQLTHTVSRGDLVVTVTEDGNLESAKNVDIKCQVAGGSSILSIVDDGSTVKQGDKLVQLDSSTLEEQINQQKIAFEKARTLKIQAEKNFAVAQLAVKEYLEGTFKQSLQDAESAITIAQENLKSAQNSLEYSERMFRKGYVSSLELEGQRFSVQRAQLELDSAHTAREVLVNFTKAKTLQDLESQRDTADAQVKSENAAYDLEEIRLKRLENQLAGTIISAPQDGMVVYANEPAVDLASNSRRSKRAPPFANGRPSCDCPICRKCRSKSTCMNPRSKTSGPACEPAFAFWIVSGPAASRPWPTNRNPPASSRPTSRNTLRSCGSMVSPRGCGRA